MVTVPFYFCFKLIKQEDKMRRRIIAGNWENAQNHPGSPAPCKRSLCAYLLIARSLSAFPFVSGTEMVVP